jgi:hypothetical protein
MHRAASALRRTSTVLCSVDEEESARSAARGWG